MAPENPALVTKARELVHEMIVASAEVDARKARVRMLEDDPKRAAAFAVLAGMTLSLSATEGETRDYSKDKAETARHRAALEVVEAGLRGNFAAHRWPQNGQLGEGKQTEELDQSAAPLLPKNPTTNVLGPGPKKG